MAKQLKVGSLVCLDIEAISKKVPKIPKDYKNHRGIVVKKGKTNWYGEERMVFEVYWFNRKDNVKFGSYWSITDKHSPLELKEVTNG